MVAGIQKVGTPRARQQISFGEFFELSSAEHASPFLIPQSRLWGRHLPLKASLSAAMLLIASFWLSFYPHYLPISYLLLLGVYFLAGMSSLIESIEDLASFELNIDVLMTLAAFSSVLIGSGLEGGLLLVLFSLSGSMEEAVSSKAKGAISSLRKLSPTKASLIQPDGSLLERSVNDISLGDHILVKAGQIVPLDGNVIEGSSSVNMVHLTGENLPVTKEKGDEVPAGARNLDGALNLEITHTSDDSTLARIIQLVTQAQDARPKLQQWFARLSRRYAITIILCAFFFVFALPIVLGIPFTGTEGSIYRSLAFLIAASPCALILAIPIAYLSAVSACAWRGVLLKGGITLDALASCRAIAFDKTGTLTTGILHFEGMEGGDDPDTMFSVAYAMEKNAVHPIAKGILTEASRRGVKPAKLDQFRSVPGYGLEAKVTLAGKQMNAAIGNVEHIKKKISVQAGYALEEKVAALKQEGDLVAVMLLGEELAIFRFQDTIREGVIDTLFKLRTTKQMELIMLTGDHTSSANKIGKELGIDTIFAELKPEDKLKHVSELASNKPTAMIGDGINDAPALARATVGICMGKVGSTPAIDAADIVFLNDNLELLDWLIAKARKTGAIVRQNLILATCAIIFASLPALAGIVPLWLAVILHEGGTVLVGLNALRLLR